MSIFNHNPGPQTSTEFPMLPSILSFFPLVNFPSLCLQLLFKCSLFNPSLNAPLHIYQILRKWVNIINNRERESIIRIWLFLLPLLLPPGLPSFTWSIARVVRCSYFQSLWSIINTATRMILLKASFHSMKTPVLQCPFDLVPSPSLPLWGYFHHSSPHKLLPGLIFPPSVGQEYSHLRVCALLVPLPGIPFL